MKKYIVSICLGMVFLSSCSNWLDVQPKTTVEEEKVFSRELGFKEALTGVYIKMASTDLYARNLSYGFIDILGQRYQASDALTYQNELWYTFPSTKTESYTKTIWEKMYNIIANVNNLLYYCDENKQVFTTGHYYEIIKGEALGLRAFLHFDLLRMFGPVYKDNPTSKRITYRTEFSKEIKELQPSNVVMDSIISDLKKAETLLTGTDPLNFEFPVSDYEEEDMGGDRFLVYRHKRMNLYAVKAMLARVYCYKGDAESKALAVEYAKQVIAASEYFTLYKSQTASSYNSIRYAEQIFGITVNEFSNLLISNYMDMENTNTQQHFYLDGDKFNAFYETASAGNTDWRRIAEMFEVVDGGNQANVFCRKYNQKPLNSGYTYSGANAVPLIRLPEMYYIVAECASTASESAEALNTVRFARGISYSDEIPTTGYDDLDTTSEEDKNQTKRINEIMKEYRKEYFAEGQLFYFLKAHNYSTYYGCGVETMTEAHYQMTLPDDEYIFGNNSK